MNITVGIDAGSRAIKIVVVDADTKTILATAIGDQGVDQTALTARLFETALNQAGIPAQDVAGIVATGYGRHLISFASQTVTEITCHARGVVHTYPDARTVIEVGGQDSKWLCLGPDGTIVDFSMNDRCAAGTGRFLELVADRLKVNLDQLGQISMLSNNPSSISSMCVVFAETEIIGLLASGIPSRDIIAGIQQSIANRVAALAGRQTADPVYFTGGVALISGMAEALEKSLRHRVYPVENPQFTGALGAALIAADSK